MIGKVVVTSAYPDLTAMVREVAKGLELQVIIVEAVLEDALHQVESLMNLEQIDVIISRGGTAELLKVNLSLPVVSVAPSDFDVLQALAHGKTLGSSLGYFAYHGLNDSVFVEQVRLILGVEVLYYPYRNTTELASQITKAHQEGCEVVVGGGHYGVRLAQAYGMEGVLVLSSQSTVGNALQQARDLLHLRSRERMEIERRRRVVLAKGLVSHYTFADLVGEGLKETISIAKRFSQVDATVLIWGESGTGKELFAQSIHAESTRSSGPFVAVNCAALPENLLESELFGYEEGSFTGAKKGGKVGLFELAHQGTIFLDEIGKMPMSVQARLLRVLQTKELRRVGGERMIPVNVRVIAASNENLREAVEEGRFRDDLYYRLNVLNLRLLPLRERVRDIPLLIHHFFDRLEDKLGYLPRMNQEFSQALQNYSWPGNVRELENVLERYAVLVGRQDTPSYLELLNFFPELWDSDSIHGKKPEVELESFESFGTSELEAPLTVAPAAMDEIESQIIKEMLRRYDGNRTIVAQKLKISRTTLWKKLSSLPEQWLSH
ncbi:hypothetical protein JCM15765_35110 [Paradesulfitobacterium aromaticivorans]